MEGLASCICKYAGMHPCCGKACGTKQVLTALCHPTCSPIAVPEEQRETFEAARVAAASLLSRLSAHPLHGARVSLLLRWGRGNGCAGGFTNMASAPCSLNGSSWLVATALQGSLKS